MSQFENRFSVMNHKILLLLVAVITTFSIAACKQSEPKYSENDLAKNQAYVDHAAKMAVEDALKNAKPVKLVSTEGTVTSLQLQKSNEIKPAS